MTWALGFVKEGFSRCTDPSMIRVVDCSFDLHDVTAVHFHLFLYCYRTTDNCLHCVVYNFTCFLVGTYHGCYCFVVDCRHYFTIEKSQMIDWHYNDCLLARNLGQSKKDTTATATEDTEIAYFLLHLSCYWNNFETGCILVCFSGFT